MLSIVVSCLAFAVSAEQVPSSTRDALIQKACKVFPEHTDKLLNPGAISAERNIMEAYYNLENNRGHEFAYLCPGMNKVLQAAGRVIRTETDCGVVVLIDDRYSEPAIKMLLPRHFRHIKFTGNLTSLSAILSDFWAHKDTVTKK